MTLMFRDVQVARCDRETRFFYDRFDLGIWCGKIQVILLPFDADVVFSVSFPFAKSTDKS